MNNYRECRPDRQQGSVSLKKDGTSEDFPLLHYSFRFDCKYSRYTGEDLSPKSMNDKLFRIHIDQNQFLVEQYKCTGIKFSLQESCFMNFRVLQELRYE